MNKATMNMNHSHCLQ
uniref:Uncharacterized protein n=1 Tax=Arundo donax TaxID=35708 RepID=A0A0A9GGA8_ARUDO